MTSERLLRVLWVLTALAAPAWAATGCSDPPPDGDADGDVDGDTDGDGDTDVDGDVDGDTDVDGDGDVDGDADGDGDDSDGDGLPDSVEDANGNGVVDPGESDPEDADTDNDGIGDGDEGTGDGDGDGIPDVLESDTFDGDGDGTADAEDADNTDGPCSSPPKLLDDVTLSSDATLSLTCSPYVIAGNLVVAEGATLTIEAGVEVRVRRRGWITLGDGATQGDLLARGTEAAPIRFLSEEPSPAAGDWGGLYINDTTFVDLEWVSITHAGMSGSGGEEERGSLVILGGGGVSMSATTISTGLGYGVNAVPTFPSTGPIFDAFSANSITGCERALAVEIDRLGEIEEGNVLAGTIDVHGTEVSRDATWVDLGSPLRMIESTLSIVEGATLVLEQGVELIVPEETLLEVYGVLSVAGTAGAPVTIATETARAGTWQGLYFGAAGSDLRSFWISGAGAANWYTVAAAITLRELPLETADLHVVDSAGYGIYFEPEYCADGNPFATVAFEGVAECLVYCWSDYDDATCLAE